MRSHYHSIYLSPHLDDVVLSCGGQIHAQTRSGQTVLVVTIMAGEPAPASLSKFAQSLHGRWQLDEKNVVAERREEDRKACRIVGADCIQWDIPDCIYRVHPSTTQTLYPDREAIFGPVQEVEKGLVDALAQRLAGLPERDQLVAPLTVGNHVDHQITRLAAESVARSTLAYYEDYPYAQVEGALSAALDEEKVAWRSRVVPLEEQDLQAKIASISAYVSQLSTFFADRSDLEQQVRLFTHKVGGERLWFRVGGFRSQDTL